MNSNIKLARELVRIAHMIIAWKRTFHSFDDITDFSVINEDNIADIGELVMPFIWKYLNEYNFDKNDAEDIRQEFVMSVLRMYRNGYFNREYNAPDDPKKMQIGHAKMSTFFFRIAEHTILMYYKKHHVLVQKTDENHKQHLVRNPMKLVTTVNETQDYVDKQFGKELVSQYRAEAFNEIVPDIVDAIESLKVYNSFYWLVIKEYFGNGKKLPELISEWKMKPSKVKNAYILGKKFLERTMLPVYHKYKKSLKDIDHLYKMHFIASDFVEELLSNPEIWKAYDEKYNKPGQEDEAPLI